MNKTKTVFDKKKETVWGKIKRFAFCIAVYLPAICILYGGGYYLKAHMSDYMNAYFNVEVAQKVATQTQARVDRIKKSMSFPIDLPSYLSAGTDNIAAVTKAATLETTARMATGLLKGLINLAVILLSVYFAFKILNTYKTRTAESRITRQVVNELLPVLNEINENIKNITSKNQTNVSA